jgi:hypothetical protein
MPVHVDFELPNEKNPPFCVPHRSYVNSLDIQALGAIAAASTEIGPASGLESDYNRKTLM